MRWFGTWMGILLLALVVPATATATQQEDGWEDEDDIEGEGEDDPLAQAQQHIRLGVMHAIIAGSSFGGSMALVFSGVFDGSPERRHVGGVMSLTLSVTTFAFAVSHLWAADQLRRLASGKELRGNWQTLGDYPKWVKGQVLLNAGISTALGGLLGFLTIILDGADGSSSPGSWLGELPYLILAAGIDAGIGIPIAIAGATESKVVSDAVLGSVEVGLMPIQDPRTPALVDGLALAIYGRF